MSAAMRERIRLLIVEDDPNDAELMVRALKRAGFDPTWERVENEADYLMRLDAEPEIILSDSNLPEFDGIQALDLLKKRGLDIPFVLVSGRVGEDMAVEAMKRGAYDYLLKDRLTRLGEAVRRAIDERRLRREKAWAVEALRQSEERYRLVSEISSDYACSLAVKPSGALECEWTTEPFTRITGYTIAEINAIGWANLYLDEDRQISDRHHESLLANQSDSTELRILAKDNQVRWVRVIGRPIWDDSQGRVVRIFGAAQDITAEKHLEEQLLHAKKMEAIGRLAGGVAHDFNNLLTVIDGYGGILKETSTPENAEAIDEILEASGRAGRLTKQLLAFSRRQVLQPKIVDLNTVVADVERLLQRLIGEHIELRTIPCRDPGLVKVDRGQMEQVIMNLAVNARDAMPDGGRLTIETAHIDLDSAHSSNHTGVQPGPYILLAVGDTGVGMSKELTARIFEPFFTTKEVGKGTGLGLAMVYGIVKQSGGTIWVFSEPNQGTTFKIYLPRAQRMEAATETPTPRAVPAPGNETILVLEDESAIRALIRKVLVQHGYTVLDTGDSNMALRICARHEGEIALLLTDVILPKLSGPQVAGHVLRLRPEIKVLYTSGYTDDAITHHGVPAQSPSLLEKPFSAETLLRRVRETLDDTSRPS
jgi:PAS domain S-box-containing protein